MPSRRGPRLRHQLHRIVSVGNRRDDLADRQAAVQHVGAVFAIDDDHRAVGVFDDGAAELERGAGMVSRTFGGRGLQPSPQPGDG